jgi:hypothetical protein
MKNVSLRIIILFLPVIMLSCGALPVNSSGSQSWSIPATDRKKNKTTLTILSVQADRTGGWDSLEKETAVLAPLYFWNHGCRVIPAEEQPAYAAIVQIREREFSHGWRTKRSLAVEIRIWAYNDAPAAGAPVYDQKLPAAVGRVTVIGNKTFSSSDTTDHLLSSAIGKAARKLAVHERRKKKNA